MISFDLDKNITLVSAKQGLRGGASLWVTALPADEEAILQEL
jgi:hypothetical protein